MRGMRNPLRSVCKRERNMRWCCYGIGAIKDKLTLKSRRCHASNTHNKQTNAHSAKNSKFFAFVQQTGAGMLKACLFRPNKTAHTSVSYVVILAHIHMVMTNTQCIQHKYTLIHTHRNVWFSSIKLFYLNRTSAHIYSY